MLYEYPAIFHTIEEGYQISFLTLVVALGRFFASCYDESICVLSHIIKGYGDKPYQSRLR